MWLRRFTNYLLNHHWQAIAITFIFAACPGFGTFSSLVAAMLKLVATLIAAFMTLVYGPAIGAGFTLVATLPYVLSILGMHHAVAPLLQLMLWVAVGSALLNNLFTWLFAAMLYRKADWNVILQVAALIGVLVISIVHLAYPNIADWWGQQLQASYQQAQALAGIKIPNDAQLEAINATKYYASGFIAAFILVHVLIQVIMGRWWQLWMFKKGSLRAELHHIRLSSLAGVLYIISMIFVYIGNSVVVDIMPIVNALFIAAGLSVIHYAFGLMRTPVVWFWLALLYTTIIYTTLLGSPAAMFIIILIAVADIWLNLRLYIKNFNSN